MNDLVHILSTLQDKDGVIQIAGINNEVAPLTSAEEKLYEKIYFKVSEYKQDIGTNQLLHNENKEKILMHRWRYPSLSIHGQSDFNVMITLVKMFFQALRVLSVNQARKLSSLGKLLESFLFVWYPINNLNKWRNMWWTMSMSSGRSMAALMT